MKGLSADIEIAIENLIEGLEYAIDVASLDDEKLGSVVKSKVSSFTYCKQLIVKWENSLNSPSDEKLRYYVEKLVKAGDSSLDILRMAFRKKIDYSELDETKHHTVGQAKAQLHEAIVQIDSALIDLRMQLESENYNLTEKEYKRGYPEKFSNQEMFPLKNYWKKWYNEEKDAVNICPFSTEGEMITLDNLNIILPKQPPRTKILYHQFKREDQYWRRLSVPQGLTPDTVDAYAEFIIEEFRRRREGLWFYNNGIPTYITGAHYFAMQWVKMEDNGSYMNYREAQRDMFYFTRACVIDDRCIGEMFVKSRRTGFTYQIICEMLNDATGMKNANFGITSKSDDDASKAFSKLSYGFLNLPFFFRPIVKGAEDSKKELYFAKPTENSKRSKLSRDTNTDEYLNTRLDYQPTKESAYDGQKMTRYLADESSKWTLGRSFEKHWGQVAPTMDEGGTIVGKAFVGSSVNAMKKGGQEFYNLYQASQVKNRNRITGRTASGLYSYFLPAHKNMSEYTDKYGKCWEVSPKEGFTNAAGKHVKIGSIKFLLERRKAKRAESDIAYNEELRAFPMTIDEAFRDELSNSLFNIEKINEQKTYNRENMIADDLVIGNFYWEGGIRHSKVVFKHESNGRFHLAWLPPKELQNGNELLFNWGVWAKSPLNGHIGALGCDPYDISGTTENVTMAGDTDNEVGRGSKGAISGVTSFNMMDVPSNLFFLEYVARPQTAEMFFEDVLMACVFYSMPILIENNKPRLLYHFKNNGYRHYCITRFDKPSNKLSATERELGGVPNSSEDMKQMHAGAIEAYIERHVGINRETGECGIMPFERTLNDWLHFDINKRTKFDAGISSGLALMAINRVSYIQKTIAKPIQIKIKTYNHNNNNIESEW